MNNSYTLIEYLTLILFLLLMTVLTIGVTFIGIILIPFYKLSIADDFCIDVMEVFESPLNFLDEVISNAR